jgi:hypothetical protein
MHRTWLAGLLLFSLSVAAQEKIKVLFICDCTDRVGSMFANTMRDRLASSPRFSSTNEIDIVGDEHSGPITLTINAVSIDPAIDKRGQDAMETLAPG